MPAQLHGIKISFQDYLLMVVQHKQEHPEWRMGQTYFNVLERVNEKKANEIRGSWLDPFHQDKVIGNFLYEVCATWEG